MATTASLARPDINHRVLLVERPAGVPQAEHFRIEASPVVSPAQGELLIRNLYLSVDPAQRGWASDGSNYSPPVPLGSVMRALAVGQVTNDRTGRYAPGDHVYGWFGWQEYALVSAGAVLTHIPEPAAPLSAYAGILGINGLTAELAFHLLGRPSPGETVLVSTAAGAVGSAVGQIARHAGCRAIGIAGGPDKVARCTRRYGYRAAVDYRTGDWEEALRQTAPDGFDIYFDNVGGTMLDAALRQMRVGGRVIQCGTASVANWMPTPQGPRAEREVLTRRLSWGGFVVFDHAARFGEATERLLGLIRSGALIYDEDIDVGIGAAPAALRALYAGRNNGKKLIFVG